VPGGVDHGIFPQRGKKVGKDRGGPEKGETSGEITGVLPRH
jgi:hypothetical protein